MNKKRVLFLHNEFPSGGAERVTVDIADYISERGFDIYVLAREIRDWSLPNMTLLELPDKMSVNSKENADAIIDIYQFRRCLIYLIYEVIHIVKLYLLCMVCLSGRLQVIFILRRSVFGLHRLSGWGGF